jgi:hypothetical protein
MKDWNILEERLQISITPEELEKIHMPLIDKERK